MEAVAAAAFQPLQRRVTGEGPPAPTVYLQSDFRKPTPGPLVLGVRVCVCICACLGKGWLHDRQALQSGHHVSLDQLRGKISDGSDHFARPGCGVGGQGRTSLAHPGKRRGRRAPQLGHWGPQSPSAQGVRRREPCWRLRPPLPPARSLRWLCPQRCSLDRDRGPGLHRALAAPLARSPGCSLQQGAPWRARRAPPSPGRAQSLPVRPASLRGGAGDDGEAEPGSPPRVPRPSLPTAPKPVTRRHRPRHKAGGWGHPGLRPLPGVAASPGAMRACAGCSLPGRCPRARPGRRAPAPAPAAARGVPRR